MSWVSHHAPARRRPGGRLGRAWRDVRRRLRLRAAETALLGLIALVLAVATVYDLTRQVGINDRIHADLVSWQAITGAPYRNAFVEFDAKHYTTRDVACGWTPRTDPRRRAMSCLIFTGPVHGWRRHAVGGYYVLGIGPAKRRRAFDRARYRYGCYGAARAEGFRCAARARGPRRAPARGAVSRPPSA